MTLTSATAPPVTRRPVAAYVVIAAAWAAAITAEATGQGHRVHHGEIGGGGRSLLFSLLLFLAAWQVMIAAMMLPSTLPMYRLFRTTAADNARSAGSRVAFLSGYLAVWTVFGLAALAVDAGLHHLTDATPWLHTRPWIVTGSLLLLAGAGQFLPLTQACLRSCRHPFYYLFQHYRPGVRAALRLGTSHGLYCVGCCWALMLVMLATGMANLLWMALLTSVMTYQKIGRHGDRLAAMLGIALLCAGTAMLLAHDVLPGADATQMHHHHQ
jgi:predicted metal-binding membrane protein